MLNAGLIVGSSNDAPIALVAEDFGRGSVGFAIGPWLGVLAFAGVLFWLYSWMLRRSRMAPDQ